MFDHKHYVPILRWKQAERLALRDLDAGTRAGMTPLVEVTPRALAAEETADPEDVDKRCSKIAAEIISDWGDGRIFVDLGLIAPDVRATGGVHPLATILQEGRGLFPSFVPVTGLSRDAAYQDAVRSVVTADGLGVCLRLKVRELERPGLSAEMDQLLTRLGVDCGQVDVLVDFGVVGDTLPSLAAVCERLPNLSDWRTFTVASGAFPENLTGMRVGEHVLSRRDWRTWRDQITVRPPLPRLPAYGDYTIQHPVFREPGFGLNFSASIRYTAEEDWVVMRGEGVRSDEGPGYSQWPANATLLCERPEYRGANFSAGDRYIKEMSGEVEKNGSGRTGSAGTWLQAAFNHHLTLTVYQISTLFDSSTGDVP